MKGRSLLKPLLTAVLAVAAIAPVFAQTAPKNAITAEQKADVLASMERVITRSAFVPGVDFSKWPEMVEKQRSAIDKAATTDEFTDAVNSVLYTFGFSHITLFPPSFGEQRTTQRRGGIGIRIEQEEKGLRVVFVFPGSPAEKIGIHTGDLIFEADGKSVKTVADLSGDVGSTSKIKIDRAGKTLALDVTREEYNTRIPESLTWVNPDTALVTIPTFDNTYDPENVDKIMKEAMNSKTMIIDLRQNGGGAVMYLMHFMGYFLDRDTQPMGTFISRDVYTAYNTKYGKDPANLKDAADFAKQKVRALAFDGGVYKGKVAVLISGATGSASEMAAAALRDYRKSALIGSKSAGAVLASRMMPLENGHKFWIQFPMTDYVTINGMRLEGNGLKPDMEAAIPRFAEPDKAVEAALTWAKSKNEGS